MHRSPHLHLRYASVTISPSLMSALFSACAVGNANAYPLDQSGPKRAMCMMQQSKLSWNIHHSRRAPDECQTSRAGVVKVKGCQARSWPGELNKCFMNFKQLAVYPPAILRDQRFEKKKNGVLAGRIICIYLHGTF